MLVFDKTNLNNCDIKKYKLVFLGIVPVLVEGFLMIIPVMNFIERFYINPSESVEAAFNLPFFGASNVTLDFVAFTILFVVCNFVILFSQKKYLCGFCFFGALTSSCLALYRFDEILSIKIFFIIVLFISLCIKYSYFISLPLSLFSFFVFTLILSHPDFLGIIENRGDLIVLEGPMLVIYLGAILFAVIFSILYRFIVLTLWESLAINSHLNQSMTQMTAFNQELQEYAKNRGGEAAQMERLRITRDLHDSCGYVFVNIMCLMEACCSAKEMEWGRVKETFETVRGLASHGLQETRKTLRTIREIQNPMENGLDSLYEIKRIFQNVTNIKVTLDKGNMKNDYGPAVNKILIRTMQEGLTNSVRHGRATEVSVDFRDDGDNLFMTVIDNGIGSKQVIKGIGLAGMEERLNVLGGELKTMPGIEGGFKLEIKIPVIQSLMEDYEKSKVNAG